MIDFKLLTTQKLPIQIQELQFCVYSKDQLIREKIQKTVSLLNLNQFKLKYSFFTNLDESIEFITYNQKSKILFLDYNQMQTIPEEIGDLMKLEALSIHHNQVSTLPDS